MEGHALSWPYTIIGRDEARPLCAPPGGKLQGKGVSHPAGGSGTLPADGLPGQEKQVAIANWRGQVSILNKSLTRKNFTIFNIET